MPAPYEIGIDQSENESYSVRSMVYIREDGNVTTTNIVNRPIGRVVDTTDTTEIVDYEGNVISVVTHGGETDFLNGWNIENNTLTNDTPTINDKKIEELTKRVSNLEKLLQEYIQRENKFYKQAKKNNRHNDAISGLEIE